MSLRKLVEGDCGGVNPLMQLGAQFTRDVARRDDGLTNVQYEQSKQQGERMVNEFLGQVNAQPASFRMDTLLQEMREIEKVNAAQQQMHAAPTVIHEVTSMPHMLHVQPQQQQISNVHEFFEDNTQISRAMYVSSMPRFMHPPPAVMMPAIMPPPTYATFNHINNAASISGEQFFAEAASLDAMEDNVLDFGNSEFNEEAASNYNEKFWQRLQDEWSKLSVDSEHPWLSELDDHYDPYKNYEYVVDNPMTNVPNAMAQGEEFLKQGDIPSAVLCFEAATQQQPDSAQAWEMLGVSQAENEMDPQAIAALKRALELHPDNKRVLMSLAVCYTNESLQNHALKMLVQWLIIHPNYKHLVDEQPDLRHIDGPMFSSMVPGGRLQQLQDTFLKAAALNGSQIDGDVQEALGVLYNLSADYEKAAECFRAALSVDGGNAKIWNRLGASLANGSRSAEAVEAYQRALALEPGFIRVRYNVGVCCMNLKAYEQAAEHLLTALNMQANNRNFSMDEKGAVAFDYDQPKMSSCIWSTLKMVLSLLGRNELQGFANDRDLVSLNREFNIQ